MSWVPRDGLTNMIPIGLPEPTADTAIERLRAEGAVPARTIAA